jgi:uncharacterized protein YpiB (UPF0302 family)
METISVIEKKNFIKYLLNNYKFKRRECVWILNFMLEKNDILEKVRFTKDAANEKRGVIMSTDCVDEPAFRYFREDTMTTDAEKGFHDIRLNRDDILYVEFRYGDSHSCTKYASVLDSEYKPPYGSKSRQIHDTIDNLFDNVMYKQRLRILDELINKALDEKDEESFIIHSTAKNRLLGQTLEIKYETVKSRK